jgi:pyruvate,water dikinase
VGGKGANLGELIKVGIPIPPGFCVTTEAYSYFIKSNHLTEQINSHLETLDTGVSVGEVSKKIREIIISASIPEDLKKMIVDEFASVADHHNFAVRSSATSEDSAEASFAGQLETYLNIRGVEDILTKIKAGWASLFTDRAILYRQTNKIENATVKIAIIVQQMVISTKSGIMFTADPLSENRNIISIDAGFGLGEALVSGIVTADNFRVHKKSWTILDRKIASKKVAIYPKGLDESGVITQELEHSLQNIPTLNDQELIQLAKLGQQIEDHYGHPQDIEWAMQEDKLFITQSRPITTLYPLPRPVDNNPHLFINFNYIQVMTDPIRPLGQSVIRMMIIGDINEHSEAKSIGFPAGGRLFFEITPLLTLKPFRKKAAEMIGFMVDPAFGRALQAGIDRLGPRLDEIPSVRKIGMKFFRKLPPIVVKGMINIFFRDPRKLFRKVNEYLEEQVRIYTEMVEKDQTPLETLFTIEAVLHQVLLKTIISVAPVLLSVVLPYNFLEKILKAKGLDKELADITRGLVGNVTTQMDLDVASLADVLIQSNKNPDAPEFKQKFDEFLAKFGMRGPSEIDITRNRYTEDTAPLLRIIEGNIPNKTIGSHLEHRDALIQQAQVAETKILKAFWGPKKHFVKRFIKVYRNMMPFRESPKYMMIRVFWVIKKRLLGFGEALQKSGWITNQKDIYYLQLSDIQQIFECSPEQQTMQMVKIKELIETRRRDYERYFKLQSPKFITGEGEIMRGEHILENVPNNAILGSSVSAGIVEGIAHVIRDTTTEVLQKGEILVTQFTDPGWTPLFINAAALVMEVGGMMTHGSVIAREYGIPAVVGVENATSKIQSGQKIRVNGDIGIIEFL